ncbi:EF-hand domain-containing protein [Cystobacter fuscus]|uniref:EF-hand domain-containing protein n=1 Tax=Cystobacter fuscus TaxID=43 RepID=UPI001E538D34|nr:EF-hand domain-containing protein [Cystobacter fuscus]
MTTDLQAKKFNYVFKWFDQNGDGWITRDDIEKMVKLFTPLADEKDQKNKSAMDKGFMNWWNLLLEARENKASEKIGKQEFIRIMDAVVIAPKNFEIAVGNIVDGLLGALDRDGNGSLSKEEYVGMYDALGIPPTTSTEAFRRLDRDSDGEISRAEFHQALFEYYLSADPNAPGNWLLGPMDVLK